MKTTIQIKEKLTKCNNTWTSALSKNKSLSDEPKPLA